MPSCRCLTSRAMVALLSGVVVHTCVSFLAYENYFLAPLRSACLNAYKYIESSDKELPATTTTVYLPVPEEVLSEIGLHVLSHGSTSHPNMLLSRWTTATTPPRLSFTANKTLIAIINAFVLDVINGATDRFARANATNSHLSFSNLVSRQEYSNSKSKQDWQIGNQMHNPDILLLGCIPSVTTNGSNYSCSELAPVHDNSTTKISPSSPKKARRDVLKAFTNKELELLHRHKNGRDWKFPSHAFCAFDGSLLHDLHARHSSSRSVATTWETHREIATLAHVTTSCLSCDGMRPPELHAVVLWRGKQDLTRALTILNQTKTFQELELVATVDLAPLGEKYLAKWCFIMYSGRGQAQPRCRKSKTKEQRPFPIVLVVRDPSPAYKWAKSGNPLSPPQYMNSRLRTYKVLLRKEIKAHPQFTGCHSSINVEEATLAIDYLKNWFPKLQSLASTRPQLGPREGFQNLSHAIGFANSYQGIDVPCSKMAFGGCSKTARTGMPSSKDVFSNNYFDFKTITGAKATNKFLMREVGRKDTTATDCNIDLAGGSTVEIRVRSLDDGYVCPIWVADSIATADRSTALMTRLNAGFMSLYILWTYHKGRASLEQAKYIFSLLDGITIFVKDAKKKEAQLQIGFGIDEIRKGHESVKVALYHFMEFHSYSMEADIKFTGDKKTVNVWWKDLTDVGWVDDDLTRPMPFVRLRKESS